MVKNKSVSYPNAKYEILKNALKSKKTKHAVDLLKNQNGLIKSKIDKQH